MNVAFDIEVNEVLRKDSLHMGPQDRLLVRAAVLKSDTRHVLITHGTDTMVETANALQDVGDRTIVLTGALNPARFRDSCGEQGRAARSWRHRGSSVWLLRMN